MSRSNQTGESGTEIDAMNADFAEIAIPMPWGHVAGRWYGDRKQRPLILLHGWLDNCGTFARLAPLLQPYTNLLCIDFPGNGHSTHLPAGSLYNIMEYVRTVLRLMNVYKWEKISLLGHSMGGGVAFIFAALFPDRVDMLITAEIVLPYFDIDQQSRIMAHCIDQGLVYNERLVEQSPLKEPPTYTYEECERLLYTSSQYSVLLENCKYLLERNLSRSSIYPNKYYFTRDNRCKAFYMQNFSFGLFESMIERLCRNRMPYLVLQGGASTNPVSSDILKFVPLLESQNSNFEMHVVPDATHHLHLNNPKEVADAIIDFWKRKHWPSEAEVAKSAEIERPAPIFYRAAKM